MYLMCHSFIEISFIYTNAQDMRLDWIRFMSGLVATPMMIYCGSISVGLEHLIQALLFLLILEVLLGAPQYSYSLMD